METKQSQIKINLSTYLKNKVRVRAGRYGLTLAGFGRYLMIKDLEESNSLELSEESIKAIKLARKEEKEGKLKEISNISDFFAKMSK